MNFIAPTRPSCRRDEVASGREVALPAGDTYSSLLVKFIGIGNKLKIQSIAMEHARNRAAQGDWRGVQIGLTVLCAAADDIRKLAAAAKEGLDVDMDDASNVYGD